MNHTDFQFCIFFTIGIRHGGYTSKFTQLNSSSFKVVRIMGILNEIYTLAKCRIIDLLSTDSAKKCYFFHTCLNISFLVILCMYNCTYNATYNLWHSWDPRGCNWQWRIKDSLKKAKIRSWFASFLTARNYVNM